MVSVLVTGAHGAFGQAVVNRMKRDARYRVIPAGRTRIEAGGIQLDVRDRAQIDAALAQTQPDLVVHLAATFVNDFDEAYAINVEAARQMLEAVQGLSRPTRVLLVGSAAEYGAVQPEENPIRTDRALKPVSVYGMTKAWQTQLAGVYASRGVDVVVARVFNLDGPGMSERLFIGRLQHQINELRAGQRHALEFGPLGAIRDYVSTSDAAEQILAIAAGARGGDIHHVASGVPIAMRDLLARHLAAHQLDMRIVKEAPELTNRTGYDVPAVYADVRSTTQLLDMWRATEHA